MAVCLRCNPTLQLDWASQRPCRLGGDEVLCHTVQFADPSLLNLLKATADTLRLQRKARGKAQGVPHKALGFVQNMAQALRIQQLAAHYQVSGAPNSRLN